MQVVHCSSLLPKLFHDIVPSFKFSLHEMICNRGQKQTFFDPLPPHLFHVVIEFPLWQNCCFAAKNKPHSALQIIWLLCKRNFLNVNHGKLGRLKVNLIICKLQCHLTNSFQLGSHSPSYFLLYKLCMVSNKTFGCWVFTNGMKIVLGIYIFVSSGRVDKWNKTSKAFFSCLFKHYNIS